MLNRFARAAVWLAVALGLPACGRETRLLVTVRPADGVGAIYQSLEIRVLQGENDWRLEVEPGSVRLPAQIRLDVLEPADALLDVCATGLLAGAPVVYGCETVALRSGETRRVEVIVYTSVCGDGEIGGGEACDGPALGNETCGTRGFAAGALACRSTCWRFDEGGCSTCGNGIAETGGGDESCDQADLAGATCAGAGYVAGVLRCDASCRLDPSLCTGPLAPLPRKPANDDDVGSIYVPGSLRPQFAWDASTSQDGDAIAYYELAYGADPTFVTGVTTVTTPLSSHQPALDLPASLLRPVGTRYYWRVRACAVDGECSSWSPTWWLNVGRSRKDLDGDGYADVVVGAIGGVSADYAGAAYVYLGGGGDSFPFVPGAVLADAAGGPGEAFGWSVAIAGDVDGDSFADIVVGAPASGASEANGGTAYLFRGGPAGFDPQVDATMTDPGPLPFGWMGNAVAAAGDLNRDGYADVAIGAPAADAPGAEGARVLVYFGAPSIATSAAWEPSVTLTATEVEVFGFSLAGGDLDGDGHSDLVVGAPCSTLFDKGGACNAVDAFCQGPGRVLVYRGAPGGVLDPEADWVLVGEEVDDHFGSSVAVAGDVNGDGFGDLVVGATGSDVTAPCSGAAYVYFGAPGGPGPEPAARLDGGASLDLFGIAVTGAGDLNGDGLYDVAVGAYGANAPATDAGRVYVYLSAPGMAFGDIPAAVISGTASTDMLGWSLGGGSDVNGDGYADLLVGGARNNLPVPLDPGRVWMFFGGPGGSLDTVADGAAAGSPGATLGWSVD